jgi:hypothetical protein
MPSGIGQSTITTDVSRRRRVVAVMEGLLRAERLHDRDVRRTRGRGRV